MPTISEIHQLFCKNTVRASTFNCDPYDKEVYLPIVVFADNLDRVGISHLWYEWQRHLVNMIKSDENHELIDIVSKYMQDDDQFPPDLLKLLRTQMILKALKPDCIIEIGCGTSSLVLSNESLKQDIPFLCIDSSGEWLNTTKLKIKKSINDDSDVALFYQHKNWDNTIDEIVDITQGKKKIFFYLDAVLDSSIDHFQGLKTIINAVDSSTSQINILIDSRKKAVVNLHHLAAKLNKSLMVSTNLLKFRKSPSGNELIKLQRILDDSFLRMSAATFVSSLC